MNFTQIKSVSRYSISVIIILYLFDTLSNLPLGIFYAVFSTTLLGAQVLFFIAYTVKALKEKRVNKIYLYLLPVVLIPFISSIMSHEIYGQPYLYGWLSERTKLNFIFSIMLIFLLDRNWLTIKFIEKSMLISSILVVLLLYYLFYFVDPYQFAETNFVVFSQEKGGVFKVSKQLPAFLFFYLFAKLLQEFKLSRIVAMLLIVFCLAIVVKARALTFCMLISLLLYVLFYLKVKSKLILLSISSFFGFFIFLLLGLFFREESSQLQELFLSASNVFLGGEVSDISSVSRIDQFDKAYEAFLKSPVFGNGYLSTQWNDGFNGLYGYFYPSDIGWMGVLFLYGTFGFLILKSLFFIFFTFKVIQRTSSNPFLNALIMFFIMIFIYGIFSAYEEKRFGMVAFVFALIYYFEYHQKRITSANAKENIT